MSFHIISPYRPLGFGYVIPGLININRYIQNKTYTHTIKMLKFKILKCNSYSKHCHIGPLVIVIMRTYVRVGRTVYLKGRRINKAVSQDGGFVKQV